MRRATSGRAKLHGLGRRALPSVSVVVPAYNVADRLSGIVEAGLICAATRPVEMVIVNDCSTDQTWSRLLELKEQHPELHVVDLGEPYPDNAVRLAGARRATGDLVCFATPLTDQAVLAYIVESDARPREEVVAELEAAPGASAAGGRLLAQAFPPGVSVHLGGAARRQPLEASGSSRHRRRLVVAAAVGVLAASMGTLLAARDGGGEAASVFRGGGSESPSDLAPTPAARPTSPGVTSYPVELVAVRSGSGAERARKSGQPDAVANGASGSGSTASGAIPATLPEARTPSPGSGGGGGGAPVQQPALPDEGETVPDAPVAPPPSSHPGTVPSHPDGPPPSAPPAAPGDRPDTPPGSGGGGGNGGGGADPPSPEPPPAPSPPSQPPPQEPPAPGPGNGNGNANGHGDGTGNGNGHGNGNANGHGNGNGNGKGR